LLPKLGPFLQTSHVAAIAELLHTYLQGARLARAHTQTPIGSSSSGSPQFFERKKVSVRATTRFFDISQ
jgi:hypothetical protein